MLKRCRNFTAFSGLVSNNYITCWSLKRQFNQTQTNMEYNFNDNETHTSQEPNKTGTINNENMEYRQTDEPYLWLHDEDKNIFVMGIFHYEYTSVLQVQNSLMTFKPDAIIIELCPYRGKELDKTISQYIKTYYYSPRDVESCAILCGKELKAELIFGDLPEKLTRSQIEEINPEMSPFLKSAIGFKQPFIMNQLQVNNNSSNMDNNNTIDNNGYNAGDIIKDGGKEYIIDDIGNKWDISTREGFRYVLQYDPSLKNKDIKRILYDEREKHLIKNIIKCRKKKIVCIVGMGHLDGIEKYWQDTNFWSDIPFWTTKMDHEYTPQPTFFEKMENRFNATRFGQFVNYAFVPRMHRIRKRFLWKS